MTIDIQRKISWKKLVLFYTIAFAIIAAGVFSVFLLSGRSFIQHSDGFRQGFFWIYSFKQSLNSLLSGNGLPFWSWSKGFGMEISYRLDPFNLIAALFPVKYLELGISLMVVLKLYLGGLAFAFLCRHLNLSMFQCVAASVCYVFSGWFVSISMTQSSFVYVCFMLPLLILSVEKIYRNESPLLFIFTVAYYLIRDTYMAYMAAIICVIYIVLRYFAYNPSFNIKNFFIQIGRFILYGLIGCLIAAAIIIPFVLSVLNANTDSSHNSVDILCGSSMLLSLGKTFLGVGLTSSYSYLGLPALVILLLPLVLCKVRLKNTNALMTAILIAFMFFPIISSMFNGFGYPTGRWYVFIVFFSCLSAAEVMDIKLLSQKRNYMLLWAWLGIVILCTIGFYEIGILPSSLRGLAFMLSSIAGAIGILLAVKILPQKPIPIKARQLTILAITGLVLVFSWSMNFYLNGSKFLHIGEVSSMLNDSTQRANKYIQSDDDFYRSDQVEWINVDKTMKMPANENLYWQSNSIYVYDSFLSAGQIELNGLMGNNYGYFMRVFMLSNDNRMGLDFISGVRYFLGDDEKNNVNGSDEYAGYGFSQYTIKDGVHILKNKYDVGLGFAYDKCMSRSEFDKLSIPEKEQAILQSAIVSDNEYNKLPKSIKKLSASDADFDVDDISYSIIPGEGVKMNKHGFTADHAGAYFIISPDNAKNSQLLVSFRNLVRNEGGNIDINVSSDRLSKNAQRQSSNQSIADVHDFTFNMGYYSNFSGKFKVELSYPGEYTFDDLNIYSMDAANYDKYASRAIENRLVVTSYDSSEVLGTVNAEKDGLLYLSIPMCNNWKVYVDGKECEVISNTNIAFMSVEISKGTHEIVLKYENTPFKLGVFLSILGIIAALAAEFIHRRAFSQ